MSGHEMRGEERVWSLCHGECVGEAQELLRAVRQLFQCIGRR